MICRNNVAFIHCHDSNVTVDLCMDGQMCFAQRQNASHNLHKYVMHKSYICTFMRIYDPAIPLHPLFPLRFSDHGGAMSPRRRHSGGRPRSADSILNMADRWGISEKSARRLAARVLPDEAMAILVSESKRYRAAQMHQIAPIGRYTGGMRALGLRSRVPGAHA
jgi:hypothetical protein